MYICYCIMYYVSSTMLVSFTGTGWTRDHNIKPRKQSHLEVSFRKTKTFLSPSPLEHHPTGTVALIKTQQFSIENMSSCSGNLFTGNNNLDHFTRQPYFSQRENRSNSPLAGGTIRQSERDFCYKERSFSREMKP